jgi:hypothetical protein
MAVQRGGTANITTIVLAHPSERHSRFRVFGVYDDDRFVFDVRDFDENNWACLLRS